MTVRDDRIFVDTSVLVYAHDVTAGEKHEQAREILRQAWLTRNGCLSVQVLQELYVALTRGLPRVLPEAKAHHVIASLASWQTHSPRADDVLSAIDIQTQCRLSFWDAMVIRSAVALGCSKLLTEDLNHAQSYRGVTVENPFLAG